MHVPNCCIIEHLARARARSITPPYNRIEALTVPGALIGEGTEPIIGSQARGLIEACTAGRRRLNAFITEPAYTAAPQLAVWVASVRGMMIKVFTANSKNVCQTMIYVIRVIWDT